MIGMKITVTGRQISVKDSYRELAEKKLSKFDKFFGEDTEATVTFKVRKGVEIIEITIVYNGTIFRSEEENTTFNNAIDNAVESLERQIRKNKTKLERLRHMTIDVPEEETDGEDEFDVRVKTFELRPMSHEEAILQMNLLEHQFYVFLDDDSGDTCVVYKRKGGGYGLIMPEK